MKSNIPNRLIVYSKPNGHKKNFATLRSIRYLQKVEGHPRDLLKYHSLKRANTLETHFTAGPESLSTGDFYSKTFSKFLRFSSKIATSKVCLCEPVETDFVHLKSLIMQHSRTECFSVPIKNKQLKIMHYLKNIRSLSISSGIDPDMILHSHHDPMNLSHLKKLDFLTLAFNHLNYGMEIKHLCYLTNVFHKEYFQAKVSIQSKGLILLDKTMTTVPNFTGALHINALNCGYMDEDSFCFLVRDAKPFANLKELSFTLKINRNNLDHFSMLLPWLSDLEHVRKLNASFMFPFFHFDTEQFFKHICFPKNVEDLTLHFHPVAFCSAAELPESDFIQFGTQLAGLKKLKKLDMNFTVSANMETLYYLIGGLPVESDQIVKLGLKLKYHIEPTKLEMNDISLLFMWISKLKNVEELYFELDYPTYSHLDRLLSYQSLKKLRTFILKVPAYRDLQLDDGLDAFKLGSLFKFIEPSSNNMNDLEIDLASPNFNNECFGIMLHAIDEMKHLHKLECDIHNANFDNKVFKAFEKEIKSLAPLSETHIEADLAKKTEKSISGENFIDKISNLFKWRH